MIEENECLIKFPTAPTIMNPPTAMFTNLPTEAINTGTAIGGHLRSLPQQLRRVFSKSVHVALQVVIEGAAMLITFAVPNELDCA